MKDLNKKEAVGDLLDAFKEVCVQYSVQHDLNISFSVRKKSSLSQTAAKILACLFTSTMRFNANGVARCNEQLRSKGVISSFPA